MMTGLQTSTPQQPFIYDEVPYPNYTFPQTHPDRLATMGRFFGISTADPQKCRVLELGCGTGANLMSMAHSHPESKFVGIDLAETHITEAIKSAQELGISNVKFLQKDIMKLRPSQLGQFDYIVTHGIFSWVPEPVRKSILKIVSKCLSKNGVAFISFNAYPGCHIRQMVWEPMRFHVKGMETPAEKVEQGKRFLGALSNAVEKDSIYQTILREELTMIAKRANENVFHDDLESINQPFYFHQFIEKIRDFDLQYLAEADPKWMYTGHLDAGVQSVLNSLESDPLRREQYVDFINCSRFRSSLLCHKDVEINHNPKSKSPDNVFLSSNARQVSENPAKNGTVVTKFNLPDGSSANLSHPLTKAALVYLGQNWPARILFDDLMRKAWERIDSIQESDYAEETQKSWDIIVELFKAGSVRLHSTDIAVNLMMGEQPRVDSFTQWQVRAGSVSVSTPIGENVPFNSDLMRGLLLLCDGTRDRSALIEDLSKMAEIPDAEREAFEKELPGEVDRVLSQIAEAGLFVS